MTFDEWWDEAKYKFTANETKRIAKAAFEAGQENPDKQVLHKFRDICVGDGRAQTVEEKWKMANETP